MKTLSRLLILLLIVSIGSSCKKAKIDVGFDITISDLIFLIDSTSTTGSQELAATIIKANLEQELKNQKSNASLDDIKSVVLKSASIEITDPAGQTFDIVGNAEGFFSGSGLSSLRVAWKDPVPNTGQTSLDLDVTQSDIAPYIKLAELTYTLKGNLLAPHPQPTTVKGKVVLHVEAEVSPL